MPVSISGTNGVTFPDSSLQAAAASPYVLKNRIINGDFRIDQRNAGASISVQTSTTYTVDRWWVYASQNSKYTIQQNAGAVTPPSGFTNYLGATSSSAYTVLTGDYFSIQQSIEGYNFSDLDWGTANAKTITISFWVRSSLTGTFGGSLRNNAANRSFPFSYTISSANTWEQKSVTVTGCPDGVWEKTTTRAVTLFFGLGVGTTYSGTAGSWASTEYFSATGATSVVGTSGATFYITGVQLEQNTSATPFERRLYNQELANCQRYCIKYDAGGIYQRYAVGFNYSTTQNDTVLFLPVEMRAIPTLTTTGTASNYAVYHGAGTVTACNAVPTLATAASNTKIINFNVTVASGFTAGGFGVLISNANTNSYLLITAEV